LGNGWTIIIRAVIPDATALVLEANRFNDPPPEGRQFFVATVSATYTGPGSAQFSGSFRLRAVGASAVAHSTFDDRCGVIPNPLPDAEVFTGGTIEGNVCWSIRSSDATSLVMYDDANVSSGQDRVYLSLVPTISTALSPTLPAATSAPAVGTIPPSADGGTTGDAGTVEPIETRVTSLEGTVAALAAHDVADTPSPLVATELPATILPTPDDSGAVTALDPNFREETIQTDLNGMLSGNPQAHEAALGELREVLAKYQTGNCRVGFVLIAGTAPDIGTGIGLAEVVEGLLLREFPELFSSAGTERFALPGEQPFGQVGLKLFFFEGCQPAG
jgi:hypothetical protein